MKNNLYDVKSWVHVFSSLFGSVVDKRMRDYLFEDWGKMSGANCPGDELSGYSARTTCITAFLLGSCVLLSVSCHLLMLFAYYYRACQIFSFWFLMVLLC